MVGVPGRSKACHTCRRRRIKCGAELPGCHNCAKSNRICTGYQRKHTFILSQDMVVGDGAASPHTKSSVEDEDNSGMVMVSRWRVDSNRTQAAIRTKAQEKLCPESALLPRTTALPATVPTRNAFRDGFFSLLVQTNLPANNSVYCLVGGHRYNWLLQVLDLPSLSPALENALLAVCTAQLGRRADRTELVRQALKLYTEGMAQCRREILNPSTRKSEQTLAACMALLLYEIIECPGGTFMGYLAHYQGYMELLRMRGASAHTSGLAHSTFQVLRIHTAIQCFRVPRKTFLADPEWQHGPWSSNPDQKSPFDRLVDILLLEVPEYIRHCQALTDMADPNQTLSSAQEVLRESREIEHLLDKWFDYFKSLVPGALYHAELSKVDTAVDDSELGKLFPVTFQFPAFIVGQSMVYYWVTLVLVQARQCYIHGMLARLVAVLDSIGRDKLPCKCKCAHHAVDTPTDCLRHFTADTLASLNYRSEWPRAIVNNICQSVEYFLGDTTRGFAPVGMLPALAVAKGFWEHAPGSWDRQIAWTDEMVERIRVNVGYHTFCNPCKH
ncbi:hypothetical protein jhhlp_006633 [Lomentospora prolificans]|uniref:Zn(2)-C6 fungal-type domain-containing protein n=1 Tax=Lomentospora prolificans TaxID=41688 RepID=A0A2N3N6G0_9PEZI|nr:hypothetical protein jhhlp_006633 [Lomentospora prolificans]